VLRIVATVLRDLSSCAAMQLRGNIDYSTSVKKLIFI